MLSLCQLLSGLGIQASLRIPFWTAQLTLQVECNYYSWFDCPVVLVVLFVSVLCTRAIHHKNEAQKTSICIRFEVRNKNECKRLFTLRSFITVRLVQNVQVFLCNSLFGHFCKRFHFKRHL